MIATIWTGQVADGAGLAAHEWGETTLRPLLRVAPGFKRYLVLVDAVTEKIMFIIEWESEATANAFKADPGTHAALAEAEQLFFVVAPTHETYDVAVIMARGN